MEYIGFIKEHDNIKEAISFNEIINGIDYHHENSILDIIEYLNGGSLIFGWMGYTSDLETQTLIAPHSYYTDGLWVWPLYFPYYLKKYPNFIINKDFLNFISTKQELNSISAVSSQKLQVIEKEFAIKLKNLS
jgi:hypothetical protein